MEAIRIVDAADIFRVAPSNEPPKKPARKRAKKSTRFNHKEALQKIKMSVANPEKKISYEIDIDRQKQMDFEKIVNDARDLVMRKSTASPKHFKRYKTRSAVVAYDENGRFKPQEAPHKLTAAELKIINLDISSLTEKSSKINTEHISKMCSDYKSITDSLQSKIIPQIIEDSNARCPFVGSIIESIFGIFNRICSNLQNSLLESDRTNKKLVEQASNDIVKFKSKLEEISNRPPVVVEKEIIIEKRIAPKQMSINTELERENDITLQRLKRLERDYVIAKSSKDIWKDAALSLCELRSPIVEQLATKQSAWSRQAELILDALNTKCSSLLNISNQLFKQWAEQAVIVFGMAVKTQGNILLHLKLISDNCHMASQTIIRDYNEIMSTETEDGVYHRFMMNGRIHKMKEDFSAWAPSIDEWLNAEHSENIMSSKTICLTLHTSFLELISATEEESIKKYTPAEITEKLRELCSKMDSAFSTLVKPNNPNTEAVLKPVSHNLREWARMLQFAIDGKPSKFLQLNGFIDSLQIRSLSFKLEDFSRQLATFVKMKTEELQSLQTSMPSLTFELHSTIDSLVGPIESGLSALKDSLSINNEIAAAWCLLYGGGCEAPFEAVSRSTIGSDFIHSYGKRFKEFEESIRIDFGHLLHEGAFDDFELKLRAWFDSAKIEINKNSSFKYHQGAQTDPVRFASFGSLPASVNQSSSEMFNILRRVPTRETFRLNKLLMTPVITLADVDCDIEQTRRKSITRNHSFSQCKAVFVTFLNPAIPVKRKDKLKPKPLPKAAEYIEEIFEGRMKRSQILKIAQTSAIFSDETGNESFSYFFANNPEKKKELNTALNKCEKNPLLYTAKCLKNGTFSQFTFDFVIGMRMIVLERDVLDPIGFVERAFSPFGILPANAGKAAVAAYRPTNIDELLFVCAFAFDCVLCGKKCDALALFRRCGKGSDVTKNGFLKFASTLSLTASPSEVSSLFDMFSDGRALNESRFLIAALYSGFFSENTVFRAFDPFDGLADPLLEPIKEAARAGHRADAAAMMAAALPEIFEGCRMGRRDTDEAILILSRAIAIAERSHQSPTVRVGFVAEGKSSVLVPL